MKPFALVLCATLLVVCSALFLFRLPTPSFAQGADTPTATRTGTLYAPTAAPPTAVPATATRVPTLNPCDIAPPPPRLLAPAKASVLFTSRVLLKWSSVPCQPAYRLEIRRDTRFGDVVLIKTLNKRAFVAHFLYQGTYAWSVTACTAHGCSAGRWRKFQAIPPIPTAVPPTRAPQPTTAPPTPAPSATTNPYRYGFFRSTCEHATGVSVHIIVFSNYNDPGSQLAGARVIASYAPDSPAFGDEIGVTNQDGEFIYTMSADGAPPYTGDTYAWVVDSNNQRISTIGGPVSLNGKPQTEPGACWMAKFYFAGGAP